MPDGVGHIRQFELYPKSNGSGTYGGPSISPLKLCFYFSKPLAIIHGNHFLLFPLLLHQYLEGSTLHFPPRLHQQGMIGRHPSLESCFWILGLQLMLPTSSLAQIGINQELLGEAHSLAVPQQFIHSDRTDPHPRPKAIMPAH